MLIADPIEVLRTSRNTLTSRLDEMRRDLAELDTQRSHLLEQIDAVAGLIDAHEQAIATLQTQEAGQ